MEPDKSELHEEAEQLVETPVFLRFREWWRAKKESLDLWGFEKYLGCDNTAFREALAAYKNLLAEIQHEYNEQVHDPNVTAAGLAEARNHRDQMFLDAKRDFVYRMPENYRVWFKKRRIFNTWRNAPESWGFHESRYWGSRSGLTLRERRVIYGGVFLVLLFALLGGLGIFSYEKPPVMAEKKIILDRDTTINVDSLARARLIEEQRIAERKRLEKLYAERKNRMIDQLNAGYYVTETTSMRSEVAMMMQLYGEKIMKINVNQKELSEDLEAMGTTLLLIDQKNPKLVTQKGPFGLPRAWKEGVRAKINWADIKAGLDVYTASHGKSE